jgi:hypothetical protein
MSHGNTAFHCDSARAADRRSRRSHRRPPRRLRVLPRRTPTSTPCPGASPRTSPPWNVLLCRLSRLALTGRNASSTCRGGRGAKRLPKAAASSLTRCANPIVQGRRADHVVHISASDPRPAPPDSKCRADVMFYSEMILSLPGSVPDPAVFPTDTTHLEIQQFVHDVVRRSRTGVPRQTVLLRRFLRQRQACLRPSRRPRPWRPNPPACGTWRVPRWCSAAAAG